MSKCSLLKYTGEALKTYERVHTLRMYQPGAVYMSPNNKPYYINNAGFLHTFDVSRAVLNDRPIYFILDMLLTKDNTLRETSRRWFDTMDEIREAFTEIIEEAKANTEAAA